MRKKHGQKKLLSIGLIQHMTYMPHGCHSIMLGEAHDRCPLLRM